MNEKNDKPDMKIINSALALLALAMACFCAVSIYGPEQADDQPEKNGNPSAPAYLPALKQISDPTRQQAGQSPEDSADTFYKRK